MQPEMVKERFKKRISISKSNYDKKKYEEEKREDKRTSFSEINRRKFIFSLEQAF